MELLNSKNLFKSNRNISFEAEKFPIPVIVVYPYFPVIEVYHQIFCTLKFIEEYVVCTERRVLLKKKGD